MKKKELRTNFQSSRYTFYICSHWKKGGVAIKHISIDLQELKNKNTLEKLAGARKVFFKTFLGTRTCIVAAFAMY